MNGFVSIISPTGQLYVRQSRIVSYQKAGGGLGGYNIKLANGSMICASEFEDAPLGFIPIRYEGKERYIAVRHIDTVRLTEDGFGYTIKTSDGYVHKGEGSIGKVVELIERYETQEV